MQSIAVSNVAYTTSAYLLRLETDAGTLTSRTSPSLAIRVSVLFCFYACPSTQDHSETDSFVNGLFKTLALGYCSDRTGRAIDTLISTAFMSPIFTAFSSAGCDGRAVFRVAITASSTVLNSIWIAVVFPWTHSYFFAFFRSAAHIHYNWLQQK